VGSASSSTEASKEKFLFVERPYGAFRRCFTLPASVDRAKISATHQDGVITVVLPKSTPASSATDIPIRSAL
jgi:HSP20 family protein